MPAGHLFAMRLLATVRYLCYKEYRLLSVAKKGDHMRFFVVVLSLFISMSLTSSVFAQETQRSEIIVEKMAFKFTRGVTNIATCFVELPKQTYLTTRDRGATGYVIGPIKGIFMTIYRAFAGISETALFMVPQPGYYDAMISPEYVWKGWEKMRSEPSRQMEGEPTAAAEGSKEN
jgi:putative exosortase-associated protein (TIGR04073 family)